MIGRNDFHFLVSDEAFSWLRLQRGRIADLAGDRKAWEAAYKASLFDEYETIVPFLPERCRGVLDIGSGLGGIDALIHRHFSRRPPLVLFDGDVAEPPESVFHADAFSNAAAARHFLVMNGCRAFAYRSLSEGFPEQPFDLIVSFASWCFHFNPETYLGQVQRCMLKNTVLIVDVRRDYKTWIAILDATFQREAVAWENDKLQRIVYHAR